MKSGAFDYLMKPFSEEELLAVVGGALEKRRTKEAYGLLRGQLRRSFAPNGMVGRSRPMLALFDDIRKAAESDATVIILGESGAGKEQVARGTHENSGRRERPFLPINCAAIPENLLEAELFGHERGAFTGAQSSKEGLLEAADGGTLFLDELCELSLVFQAKLLRAVEEGAVRRVGGRKPIQFDVRFTAATNRDIRAEIRKGRFREDLFFRLDVIEIHVPALRDRREDIPLLAAHFLEASAPRRRTKIEGITQEAMEILTRYDWPGNVRELKNAIERALAYAVGAVITVEALPEAVRRGSELEAPHSFRLWKEKTLERLEREFLKRTLDEQRGNVSRAAKALGVHRSTLQRFMRRHRLSAA
jgi:DNA-binding NtrC family response regulator